MKTITMENNDSKRMDWLETVSGQFYGPSYTGEKEGCVLYWDTAYKRDNRVEAKTLRAAIDKAMKRHSSKRHSA